jgi:hypothetical protein
MKSKVVITGIALMLAICIVVLARESYTGLTLKTSSTGCGGCHASQSSSVAVAISGPDTIQAGKTASYSVTVSGGGGTSVCVDIAASAGTLAAADANLKLSNGELITNGIKKYTGGSYTYDFKLTAPTVPQSMMLYATGMSTKSTFNFAPDKQVVVTNITTDAGGTSMTHPSGFSFAQNFPNPLNTRTSFEYALSKRSAVRIAVYDAAGRECSVVMDAFRDAGVYRTVWDGSRLPVGLYFCRMTVTDVSGNAETQTIRMTIVR